jgi:hypothetical protein
VIERSSLMKLSTSKIEPNLLRLGSVGEPPLHGI